ncbi:tyrosine-type recombinase/integrase [Roseateles sp. DC23W]|uniref:Tyrosine-type recombinase/integrase n=1 Tax=Pelomonas dachongensis TaxID=3299029 RepID=A0ABW7EK84_9BURK
MGTIIPRKRKDGSIGYTALVRIKKAGKVVHSESETFDREQAAKIWMKGREAELAKPGALTKVPDPTLSEVIDQYNREKQKTHGKTKTQVLNTIKEAALAKKRCSEIGSPELVAFAQSLKVQPQTRGNYMSHLGAIFTVARPAWGYPLDTQAMEDAQIVLKKLGLVSKSKERTRRPTLDELNQLMTHYEVVSLKRPASLPMQRLILFAIFSTRRQEEICRVTSADLERPAMQLVVRDMKNPGEKIGNDVRTTLTPEALQLIDTQPETTGCIWPYNAESVSTSFTRACALLGIDDLHFHDLRHDGISRLFELGWTIPQVAAVSGHRSWQSLKRYTHLQHTGDRFDKYQDYPWLERVLRVVTK